MVSKLDQQNFTSEFESHWVPHSLGLVSYRSKKLRKLLLPFDVLVVGGMSRLCVLYHSCMGWKTRNSWFWILLARLFENISSELNIQKRYFRRVEPLLISYGLHIFFNLFTKTFVRTVVSFQVFFSVVQSKFLGADVILYGKLLRWSLSLKLLISF